MARQDDGRKAEQASLFREKFWQDHDLIRDQLQAPGKSAGKLLLWMLISRMGKGRPSWDANIDELAFACNCSLSTIRRLMAILRDASLLSYITISGKPGWYRFWVSRTNLSDFISDQSPRKIGSHFDNARSQFKNADSQFDNGRCQFENPTSYEHQQNSTTTPNDWAAVADELFSLGVMHGRPALDDARKRGATSSDIRAGIDHFREHAPTSGWSAGALQRWVSEWRPGTQLAENWPPSKRIASADADRLAEGRKRLDALPEAEQHALAGRVLAGAPLQIYNDSGLKPDVVRTALAKELARPSEVTT